ncbi:peptidoglycan DD-metalloendopeptidase family protein [Desulforamulus ferrireducens]|uniref:Peptidase M23 n=1 Tax=Desulforamulus ferrireducens TaxID=1833852 RepID=A0A1S6J060_9FIRM|nr:M23 family metallopeptidase [Desulforamulus ferrireducens]AQS60398.1 peptidase M23 [Desulforamulus ferrireducens]
MLTINKKRWLAVITAVLVAGSVLGVIPANASLEESMCEGDYTPPLAQEVPVEVVQEKSVTASPKTAQVERVEMMYQVREGDTLWSIAQRTGITMDRLAQANNKKLDDILVTGTTLILPGIDIQQHRVAEGETLSHIAGQYGVSVDRLMAANQLDNPHLIRVGQTLQIPADSQRESVPTLKAGKIQIGGWAWPVVGEITSHFGIREDRPHEGIDIGAVSGTTIKAPAAGRVVWAAPRGTYGLTVIIDHGNGLRSLYAHCSKLLVQEGQQVARNQAIALVGSTGRSSGPHLHMEVLRQGVPVDPLLFLKERLFA